MSRKIVTLLLVLSFLISPSILSCLPVHAKSRTILVPDDFSTIIAAVGNATDGDTIFVKKGTYNEPINQTLVINKSISVIGENVSDTTLLLHPPLVPIVMFPDTRLVGYDFAVKIQDQASLVGLTITSNGAGISISGDRVVLTGNRLNQGVNIDADGVQIIGNTVTFIIVNGNNNTIANNNLTSPSTVNSFISCKGSYNAIANNTIIGYTGASSNVDGRFNVFYGNTLEKGSIGITGDDNIIGKNKITGGNINLERSSNNTIFANRIINGGGLGMGIGYNNSFFANEMVGNTIGFIIGGSKTANNTFYHNNLIGNIHQVWTGMGDHGTEYFDNGKEGNYWSDYNGTDDNNDGVGDVPHLVYGTYYGEGDRLTTTLLGRDSYPLMTPFDINSVTVRLPEWASSELQGSDPQVAEPPSATLVTIASIASVALVVAGALVYFKKRKR